MVINVLYKKHIVIASENILKTQIFGLGVDFTSFNPSFERMGAENYLDALSIKKQVSFQM